MWVRAAVEDKETGKTRRDTGKKSRHSPDQGWPAQMVTQDGRPIRGKGS